MLTETFSDLIKMFVTHSTLSFLVSGNSEKILNDLVDVDTSLIERFTIIIMQPTTNNFGLVIFDPID